MNGAQKIRRRRRRRRKLLTTRNIVTVILLLAFSALTAFVISNPLANFYTATYTLLLYLLTACGSLLIIFVVFFGFIVKAVRFLGKIFQKHR